MKAAKAAAQTLGNDADIAQAQEAYKARMAALKAKPAATTAPAADSAGFGDLST